MTFKILDRVQVGVAAAPGTGSISLGAPAAGFQSFGAAGANNNDTVPYLLVDGINWEFGIGTYSTASYPGLARTTITSSSNSNAAINASVSTVVMATLRGEDIKTLFSQLGDVALSGLTSGQVPTWNGTSWVNQTPAGGTTTLAGDTDTSISSPSDGQLLRYNGATGKWENSSGGLFSQVMSKTPTRANTGLTTVLNANTSVFSDAANGIQIVQTETATGGNINGVYKAAPSAPYTITALVGQASYTASYNAVGIGWYDGTTKLQIGSILASGVFEVSYWNSPNNGYVGSNAQYGLLPGASGRLTWLQISDDGTNVHFRYSMDGVAFMEYYSLVKSSGYLGGSGYSDVVFYGQSNGDVQTVSLLSWTQS